MKLTGIHTDPDPYEAVLISQGIRVGDMLYISGQAGYDNDGHIVEGGFLAQGKQAFANLERALRFALAAQALLMWLRSPFLSPT